MRRTCDMCGQRYYRSNKVRLWVVTNFGHRGGWQRRESSVCCKCMVDVRAQQLLVEINPHFVDDGVRRKRGVV